VLVVGCETCHLLEAANGEVLFETEFWRVTLAADQGYLGRAYVTLLEHRGGLSELTRPQVEDWHDVVIRYEGLVRGVFEAKVFNWGCLMNNAFQLPNPKTHVHWHVRPRYAVKPMWASL